MKGIKVTLASLALIMGFTSVRAQDNLTIVLKNGTELTGYISRQKPGENFTFTTSKAIVNLPQKDVKSILDLHANATTLSPEWQEWAEKNEAYEGIGSDRNLMLSDIITDKGSVNRVRVLERGAKVRYLELTPNSYSLNWDTIAVVKAPKRPKMMLSGLNRKYTLNSGMEYEGQYIEEVPGKTLSLLKYNGVVEVFNTEDVKKDSRVKINPNQKLIEQSDLLDIVQLKNGGVYKGVIFERNYTNTRNGVDYLLIELEDGRVQSVNLSDIEEYRKEKNSNYKPQTDIVLKGDEGAVNRIISKLRPTKELQGVITVNSDSIATVIHPVNPMEISVELPMENVKAQQLKLVKLRNFSDKKSKEKYTGFTYEDMVKNFVMPKSVGTSVNGVTKIEYLLPTGAEGIYGVYDPLSNRIILFKISSSGQK